MGTMSTSRAKTAALEIAKSLHDALRAQGFKRREQKLYRPLGDVTHRINFQVSRWGTSDAGSFTVNLVIASGYCYEIWTGKPPSANPASAAYPVSQRIGLLLPDRKDKLWDVDASTDIQKLSKEVETLVVEVGIPFLDGIPDLESLLVRLRGEESVPYLTVPQARVVHAMLAARLGYRDEASLQLVEALRLAGPLFKPTVLLIAERLGLTVAARRRTNRSSRRRPRRFAPRAPRLSSIVRPSKIILP